MSGGRWDYRVIGIDPALTNVGMVVLESSGPGDYRVVEAQTIRTNEKQPMLGRLAKIRMGLDGFLWETIDESGDKPFDAIAIEDPTRQHATRTKQQNPATIALLGLAVGVVVSVAQDFVRFLPDQMTDRLDIPGLDFLDVEQWMPKRLTGRLKHIMAKDEMLTYLRNQITFPAGAHTEHELMAAGVARYWIETNRFTQRVKGAIA